MSVWAFVLVWAGVEKALSFRQSVEGTTDLVGDIWGDSTGRRLARFGAAALPVAEVTLGGLLVADVLTM